MHTVFGQNVFLSEVKQLEDVNVFSYMCCMFSWLAS